jgi:hypothetical protein
MNAMAARFPTFIAAMLMACAALPGCKRKLTDANLSCVKPDMSPKEVESILGQPNKTEPFEMPLPADVKTLQAERYIYVQDGKTVTLHFVDGKLIGQEGSFEK